MSSQGNIKDLTGQRFGRLVAVKKTEIRKNRKVVWLCQCDCGNQHMVTSGSLTSGRTQSCGCFAQECRGKSVSKHHMSKTRIYSTWCSVKKRCYNQNHKSFKHYGGRGITVCDEWKNDFQAFYDWAMENGYRDDLTIDRIDVNGNYEPTNCRWVTMKEQANNRRSNVSMTLDGETHTIAEWAEIYGISETALRQRIKKMNLSLKEALNYKRR